MQLGAVLYNTRVAQHFGQKYGQAPSVSREDVRADGGQEAHASLHASLHLTIEFALGRGGECMECAFADLACALFPLGTLENVSIRVAQRTISFTDEDVERVKDAGRRGGGRRI